MELLAALQDSEKSFTTTSLSLRVTVPKRNKQQWQKGPCKVFFAMRLYLKDITSPQQVRDMMELDGSELRHTRNIAGVEKYESGEYYQNLQE